MPGFCTLVRHHQSAINTGFIRDFPTLEQTIDSTRLKLVSNWNRSWVFHSREERWCRLREARPFAGGVLFEEHKNICVEQAELMSACVGKDGQECQMCP